LLFLQENISEQDLVFGGNPRLPRVRPEGEQREYSLFPLFFPCLPRSIIEMAPPPKNSRADERASNTAGVRGASDHW
jgi:hypothetical protein